ncbi:hypothetical protein EDD85DRAFT_796093 [Armillaria nabsnona]|nr:hypothetical protein EDD85DRAFT_796093 [Armillaria nabsnona]
MTRKSLADILKFFLALLCVLSYPPTYSGACNVIVYPHFPRRSHELKCLHGTLEALVAAALDVQPPEAESSAEVLSFGFETTKLPGRPFVVAFGMFPFHVDETEGVRMYTVENTKEIDADHGKKRSM